MIFDDVLNFSFFKKRERNKDNILYTLLYYIVYFLFSRCDITLIKEILAAFMICRKIMQDNVCCFPIRAFNKWFTHILVLSYYSSSDQNWVSSVRSPFCAQRAVRHCVPSSFLAVDGVPQLSWLMKVCETIHAQRSKSLAMIARIYFRATARALEGNRISHRHDIVPIR